MQIRKTHFMPRGARLVLAVMISLAAIAMLAVGQANAEAQSAPATAKEAKPRMPVVPDDVWGQFMRAVEGNERVRTAWMMSRDAVAPIVASLESQQQVELVTRNFLSALMDGEFEEMLLGKGVWAYLNYDEVEDDTGNESTVPAFRLTIYSETSDSKEYWVPGTHLAPFSFDYVDRISVLHPLNKELQWVEFNTSLASACAELCEMAKIDYAIGNSESAPVISAKLGSRTIAEALVILASQCKWDVRVERRSQDVKILYDAESGKRESAENLNSSIDVGDVLELWKNREYANVVSRANPPITNQMEALAHLVKKHGEYITNTRTVVRIRPVQ